MVFNRRGRLGVCFMLSAIGTGGGIEPIVSIDVGGDIGIEPVVLLLRCLDSVVVDKRSAKGFPLLPYELVEL